VAAVQRHKHETEGTGNMNLFLVDNKGTRGNKFVPLTHADLVKGIKELAAAAGVDATKYSGHSLRRGGATMAFQMGVSSHLIKQQGGWKSDAVFLYHELSATDRLRLPTLMAQKAARMSYTTY
jgi:integrase